VRLFGFTKSSLRSRRSLERLLLARPARRRAPSCASRGRPPGTRVPLSLEESRQLRHCRTVGTLDSRAGVAEVEHRGVEAQKRARGFRRTVGPRCRFRKPASGSPSSPVAGLPLPVQRPEPPGKPPVARQVANGRRPGTMTLPVFVPGRHEGIRHAWGAPLESFLRK
jgi:hypothetical protein